MFLIFQAAIVIAFGLICIVFHRRMGLVGSKERAKLARFTWFPPDEFYQLLGIYVGVLFVGVGTALMVIALS